MHVFEITKKCHPKGGKYFTDIKKQEEIYMFESDVPCKGLLMSIPSKWEKLILLNKEW